MTASVSFDNRVTMPADVLVSGLDGESVLLNLESERYFGLDEVGTRMLTVLTSSTSIQAAYDALLEEYDVDAHVLRNDLVKLIDNLSEQGLVQIVAA